MRTMLGIDTNRGALPDQETRDALIAHYGACSADRVALLQRCPETWFEEEARFFEVRRTRAWILTRRCLHSAHHRGQLNAAMRAWGQPLYSTYGPTADTGGLPKEGARTIYRCEAAEVGSPHPPPAPPLPGTGAAPVTERPDRDER
jgi:hypothetical protein